MSQSQGIYKFCQNCGNTRKGDGIAKCKECGTIFCSSCANENNPGIFVKFLYLSSEGGDVCPVCHEDGEHAKPNWKKLGEIS